MQIKQIILFLSMILATSCYSQNKFIECVKAQKGNTGARGRVPKEDMNKPNKGKDFFVLELKSNKKCDVEIVNFTLRTEGVTLEMWPKFADNSTKKSFKKGDVMSIQAEKSDMMNQAKTPIKKDVYTLKLKINDQLVEIPIEKFEDILVH